MTEVLAAQLALISGTRLGLYSAVTLLTCLSPGPNVLLMISTGLRSGARAALVVVAGIMLASFVYLAVAAGGVIAAVTASPRLFTLIRYAGAAYLVYLGLKLIVTALRPQSSAADATGGVSARAAPRGQFFWQGFVTHISNPKAVLFWTAVLPQFIDTDAPVTAQVVSLGLLGMLIDAIVLAAYGLSAAAARHSLLTAPVARWLDLAAGIVFTILGAMLALTHRAG
jgi:homoserine/homoserine lactone efflux protein